MGEKDVERRTGGEYGKGYADGFNGYKRDLQKESREYVRGYKDGRQDAKKVRRR